MTIIIVLYTIIIDNIYIYMYSHSCVSIAAYSIHTAACAQMYSSLYYIIYKNEKQF